MSELLQRIALCIERGKENLASPYPPDLAGQPGARELTAEALAAGIPAAQLLSQGLICGMRTVGDRFADGKAYVPELLIAARAMYAAMELLQPAFEAGEVELKGTVILGTVAGDLHDIGKNIVRMVLEGSGWRVIDLGVDISAEQFLYALQEHPGAYLGMSALLTTTMMNMEKSVAVIRERFPEQLLFIGGAPVTPEFSEGIGADGTFPDPQSFVNHLETLV